MLRRILLTCVCLTTLGALTSLSGTASASETCPNEATRTGLSSRLPDCRAYEQVSLVEKEGAAANSVFPTGLLFRAASDGEKMFYSAEDAIAGSPAGGETSYLASRGTDEWLTTPLTPPNLLEITPKAGGVAVTGEYRWLSEDLSCKLVQTAEPLTADTPAEDVTKEVRNLYRRNEDGTYTLLSGNVPTNAGFNEGGQNKFVVLGATAGCKKVFYQTNYDLLPGSQPAEQFGLYEWDEGTLHRADILPGGGQPEELRRINSSSAWNRVSEDGSRVFFEADQHVFMREGGGTPAVRTVDVSASQTIQALSSAYFQAASKDGSVVLFMANYGLAQDSTATSQSCNPNEGMPSEVIECDLYEYDVETGVLHDISADTNPADGEGASVQGVFGVSEDANSVYFAALGQLTPESGDPRENTQAANDSEEELNVYLAHAGALTFVGRVARAELGIYSPNNDAIALFGNWAARVTPDGQTLLFTSRSNFTGYDNTDTVTGVADPEAFVFSAKSGKTVCVSCNPSGAPPTYKNQFGFPVEVTIVPLSTDGGTIEAPGAEPRPLADEGTRVFFESTDQLSPLVKGGEVNVYEWELAGAGSCTTASPTYSESADGCVFLLDSGLPASGAVPPATFLDASADGRDVFLQTGSKLVGKDSDDLFDVYDARIGGGFGESQSGGGCEGEACQGLAAATPTFGTPSSASFAAPDTQRSSSTGVKPRSLTRAQKLRRALKACDRQKGKRKRQACRRRAKKRYGAGRSASTSVRRGVKG